MATNFIQPTPHHFDIKSNGMSGRERETLVTAIVNTLTDR
jgi:hypothetical protein